MVSNWCSLVLGVQVGVRLELAWRALVRVVEVVASVWLGHAVGLQADTKLVPVDVWLTRHAPSHIIMVMGTTIVHWLAGLEIAWHHAVLNRWESLLVT